MKVNSLNLTMVPFLAVFVMGCSSEADDPETEPATGSGAATQSGAGGVSGDPTGSTGGAASQSGSGGTAEPKDAGLTGDHAGLIKQCVAACENFYSTCPNPNSVECTSVCEEWHQPLAAECYPLREAYMACIAQYPSACQASDWGYLLEDKCDPEPQNRCWQAEGKDCARRDEYAVSCGGSFSYICQEGRAPAECRDQESDISPGLYCCDNGELFQ